MKRGALECEDGWPKNVRMVAQECADGWPKNVRIGGRRM